MKKERYLLVLLVVLISALMITGCLNQNKDKPKIVETLSENNYVPSAGWQEFTCSKGMLNVRNCQNGIKDGEIVLYECTNWESQGGICNP